MDERPASATAVLDIMRDWGWQYCNPDGVLFCPGLAVNTVVNRLAMEGIRRPQAEVLTLLSQGDLLARGNYCWQKFQDLDHFRSNAEGEVIKARHWQHLARSIEDTIREPVSARIKQPMLQLPELGLHDCLAHNWEYSACRFSYAVATTTIAPFDDDYMEERFSAWSIEVWPNDLEPIIWNDEPEPETAPPTANTNKGGRPPAANWELAALEIAGRYYRGDFKPQTIADVGRELAAWLGDQDLQPSDSVVRIHAKHIFDAFQAWERE